MSVANPHPWTDDDGTGTTGTGINNAALSILYNDVFSQDICSGRLTLTSGTPVTTSDVTAATTIYFTPFGGSRVALYNGTVWIIDTFAELSIAVPATTSQMYDVFVYDNAGSATLELLAWTNDSTRATALTRQDGILVKSGAPTRRYVGSFRTTGVSGQTEDSLTKRYVWNYYNRVARNLRKAANTTAYGYNGAYRQAGNDATHQLEVVVGVAEDALRIDVSTDVFSSVFGTVSMVHIGEDSTSSPAAESQAGQYQAQAASAAAAVRAMLEKVPAAGYHKYVWLEFASAATTTWATASGGSGTPHSGMTGRVQA